MCITTLSVLPSRFRPGSTERISLLNAIRKTVCCATAGIAPARGSPNASSIADAGAIAHSWNGLIVTLPSMRKRAQRRLELAEEELAIRPREHQRWANLQHRAV